MFFFTIMVLMMCNNEIRARDGGYLHPVCSKWLAGGCVTVRRVFRMTPDHIRNLSILCLLVAHSTTPNGFSVPGTQNAATTSYNSFTRSSKHRANVEQMYSKYTC